MVSDLTPDEGAVITYTIVIRNTGMGIITHGLISDTIPTGMVITGIPTLDPPDAGSVHLPPPCLVHDLTIAYGKVVTLTFQVQALDGPARITNTAAVTSAGIYTPAIGMVAITVSNVPPIAANDGYDEVDEDETLVIAASAGVLANDADVPSEPVVTNPGPQTNAVSDTVSLTIEASDVESDTLTYSADDLPPDLSIDSATGVIAGILSKASVGTYTVTVEVSDGVLTDSVTFGWTVNEGGPAQIYLPLMMRNHAPTLYLEAETTGVTGNGVHMGIKKRGNHRITAAPG
jgi:uncharacterized repeat protein (TIGR01451 family)